MQEPPKGEEFAYKLSLGLGDEAQARKEGKP